MNFDYSYKDLLNGYRDAGLKEKSIVFIESDIASLGFYEDRSTQSILAGHLKAINEIIGTQGTIVVPTFTLSYCSSNKIFDSLNSPSEMGILSEYIRKQKNSIRSNHCLTSYSAIGKMAKKICLNASHLAYGPNSPMDRMIKYNTWFLSIGLKPHDTCSTVHQTELVMGVPYRYIKEFTIFENAPTGIFSKKSYMHVRYNSSDLNKDKRSLFEYFKERHKVLKSSVGRGFIWGYSMTDFYNSSLDYFSNNPYAILSKEPNIKPYEKTL